MVTRPRSRRGGSTLGCVFSLVLFLAALYYGVHIGQVYVRFYRLQDALRFQALMAPTIDNGVITRNEFDGYLEAMEDLVFEDDEGL